MRRPPTSAASGSTGRAGFVVIGDETIRVPGFAAYLRRHPRLTQRGGIVALAGGIALFVVASVTTPLAGANTAEPPAAPETSAPVAAPAFAEPVLDPTPPAVRTVLQRTPTHVAEPAPVSHGVISGLAANGIPKVALNAYRVAAARMGNVEPGCGIDWALLAGIGREESDHGRFGGAVLHGDGLSTPRIMGPALDGARWDYIPAPANGQELYGDGRYAHALGPMQFIPSTWALYGTDADGDGKADVFNINDAALGAARYLCAAGGNLRTRAGQIRGVLAYNHSDQYLAQVLALADAYRRGVPVTGIPVGITSGALPKVTDTGYIPPANPGAPTAVDKSTGHKTSTPKARGKTPAPGKSTKPRATPSTPSTGGGSGTKPRPTPTATKPGPQPTGSSSNPQPSPSPTPTPTKSCNPLQIFCKRT